MILVDIKFGYRAIKVSNLGTEVHNSFELHNAMGILVTGYGSSGGNIRLQGDPNIAKTTCNCHIVIP